MKLVGSLKIRQHLGCSESTFMDYVNNGALPVKKDKTGAEFVATTKDLDKWLGVRDKAKSEVEADAKSEVEADAKTEVEADGKADAKK